ncbi:MAG TPA: hypothetical protein VNQ55_05020 [Parapedobacter sp.]|nr:hypothetical protein [Parapedobacter sp.]
MFDQILSLLNKSSTGFDCIQDGEQLEIRVRGKTWSPILISKVTYDCYRISWGGIVYPRVDADNGFKRVLRLCETITSGI